ncbi:cell division protein ZipA [Marinobacter orientalis]|uniref:Cell division protein ZipA n=1 Tax=Marinobacter orientalis TaxID=1928859 RepID=A0A7Y0REP0_9GAMM|nr:cell division protein ZipA [Marinobacter orientalis]NMT64833.1 cell division protein ZipA [Marinobacter orientalis]TGX48823.1 cell division protein ZipA [Marinobacter orientalis]
MSLREWLIAIGTLVILGIVIDGLRRMRRARKESSAISSGMGADDLDDSPLDKDYNPELPNGGARTISRDTLEERGYVKPEKNRLARPDPKPTRPVVKSSRGEAAEERPAQTEKAGDTAAREPDDTSFDTDTGWGAVDDEPEMPPADDGIIGEPRIAARPKPDQSEPRAEQQSETVVPPTVTTEVEEDTARREQAAHTSGQPLAGANRPEAREVVVINVLAKTDENFTGPQLKALFEACGLEHGDMDIYHRHEQTDTNSPVQFSVASAVEPGTFRPEDMPALSTPGISFFMSMPGPTNSMQAFEFMLETAQCVVRNLGGELKDERRSVMTPQTIEHCRQRIREFERKERSPKK